MLKSIISTCQHAFVNGRQITDAIFIANELVDKTIRHDKEGILCKLDTEKAFDYVHWNSLDYMLQRMGCGEK